MLDRALPLLRVFVIVLAIALVVLFGALAWLFITEGTPSDTPQTEAERGLIAAEQAVKANPEDPIARIKLAAAYLSSQRPSDAKAQAEIANRLAPDDPSALYILGMAHDALGDTSAAIENLEKAAETEGQIAQFYQDAFVALARAHEKEGDLDTAIVVMNKAVDQGPENAILLFERGQMYERAGEYSYALMDYSWALDYVPNYEPALSAFNALSAAHPEALDQVRSWREQGEDGTGSESGS